MVAVGGGGAGPPSAPVRVTARVIPPRAPTGLTADVRPDGTVRLRWRSLGPAVSYFVYRRDLTARDRRAVRPSIPVIGGTESVTEPLLHGHEYEFTLRGLNDGGEGAASGPLRVLVRHAPPSIAPNRLLAEPGDGPGQVELTWTPVAPGGWYWIYQRDVTAKQREFTRGEVAVNGGTAILHTLVRGHQYEFKVVQYNQGGEGPFSPVAKVTPR